AYPDRVKRSRRAVVLAWILLAAACSRREPTSSTPPAANAHATVSAAPLLPAPRVSASSSAAPAPAAVTRGPVVIVPPIPPIEQDMMDHLLPNAGWSKDGAALGYCVGLAVDVGC